ncbi:hypothetical protein [Methylocucumis oryzae]|uniref:Uncharacterized protein n=1 Tax=Methylocucumis oryzae TaxID=1632867 RepID=A0A0F3INA1_9GAMM|nr:hypothetical protein [Methylocucumis oryzae]KJV08127.1 hypothetical protein VZ94_00015 [Methylocucumis oryzae]
MILKASNVQELKSFGFYCDIKDAIEKEIDIKLGVNSWASLFEKIKSLEEKVQSNKEVILSTYREGNFKETKKKVSEVLGLKIKARSWNKLKSKIERIIDVLYLSDFDPYEHYEKTKLKKFKNSSKLEGIEIEIPSEKNSLASVLAKYRRPSNG